MVLELRAAPADSMAHTQELRDAVFHRRQSGQRVMCHLEDADGSSLYLCSAADRILLNPAGGIRFAGLQSALHVFYELARQAGGSRRFRAHRCAQERAGIVHAQRRVDRNVARRLGSILLQQVEKSFMLAVSRPVGLSSTRRSCARASPRVPSSRPKRSSLAWSTALRSTITFEEATSRLALATRCCVKHDDLSCAPRTPDYFGDDPGIAIVYVDGDMVGLAAATTIPLLGTRLARFCTSIAESLKKARENPKIGAVVLRVETGGGSAMAADVIYREVQLTAAVKPVIVSMGTAAASGGYYISAPGTYVFANPTTAVTGSIGIFLRRGGCRRALEAHRRHRRSLQDGTTRRRRIHFPAFHAGRTQRARAQGVAILRRVSHARGDWSQNVEGPSRRRGAKAASGPASRRWSASWFDEIGGLRQALALARKLGHVSEHGPILELPPPDTSLLGRLLGIEGVHADDGPPAAGLLPAQLLDLVRALSPFMAITGDKPFALMEMTPVGP